MPYVALQEVVFTVGLGYKVWPFGFGVALRHLEGQRVWDVLLSSCACRVGKGLGLGGSGCQVLSVAPADPPSTLVPTSSAKSYKKVV